MKPNHLKRGTSQLLLRNVRGTNIGGTSFSAVFSSARIHDDDRAKWAAVSPDRKACLFQTRRGSLPLPRIYSETEARACVRLPSFTPRRVSRPPVTPSFTSLPLTQYLLRDPKRSEPAAPAARARAAAPRASAASISMYLSIYLSIYLGGVSACGYLSLYWCTSLSRNCRRGDAAGFTAAT